MTWAFGCPTPCYHAGVCSSDVLATELLFPFLLSTRLYQEALLNANIQTKNYILEETKALLVVEDGSRGPEVMEFLLKQKEVRRT